MTSYIPKHRHPVTLTFVLRSGFSYDVNMNVSEYEWSKPGFLDRAVDAEINDHLNTAMFDYDRPNVGVTVA